MPTALTRELSRKLYSTSNGFNGITSTDDGYFYAETGGTQSVTFSGLAFTKLEIWTWDDSSGANGTLEINGTSISSEISSIQTPKHLEKVVLSLMQRPWLLHRWHIKVSKTASEHQPASQLYVDGKMLVDKVNDSQDWSDGATTSNPPLTDYPPSNVFDGDSSTSSPATGAPPRFHLRTRQFKLRVCLRGAKTAILLSLWAVRSSRSQLMSISLRPGGRSRSVVR